MDDLFREAYAFTKLAEGGLSLDRNDPGNWTGGKIGVGELKGTKYGVSAKSYPHLDIRNLTPQQAMEIFYLGFDFAARMQGEAIQSATVTAVDSCGLRQRKEVYNASATNTNKVKTI